MFEILLLGLLAGNLNQHQVAKAHITLNSTGYTTAVKWHRAPFYAGANLASLAEEHRIAVVRCDRVSSAGRLRNCSSIQWRGASKKGDAAAIRAVRGGVIDKQQMGKLGRDMKSASVLITMRFDGVGAPIEPGPNCPVTLCS